MLLEIPTPSWQTIYSALMKKKKTRSKKTVDIRTRLQNSKVIQLQKYFKTTSLFSFKGFRIMLLLAHVVPGMLRQHDTMIFLYIKGYLSWNGMISSQYCTANHIVLQMVLIIRTVRKLYIVLKCYHLSSYVYIIIRYLIFISTHRMLMWIDLVFS